MITETIERAQQGDHEAFRELHKEYAPRVLGVCLKLTKDRAMAEDMTQETFLTAYRKLNRFRGEAAFSTWLHVIAVRTVFMSFRKRGRRLQTVPLEEVPDDDGFIPTGWAAVRDLQLEGVVDRITLNRLMKGIGPGMRKVFELHEVEGYEHHEIAAIVGRTTGNSKSQLFKAKLKLRQALSSRLK